MTITDNGSILLAFASWEDRFVQGVLRDLEIGAYRSVVVFYFSNYHSRTERARYKVHDKCQARGLEFKEVALDPSLPHENLRRLKVVTEELDATASVVVDISTMPREVIWHIFWLWEHRDTRLLYRYYNPLGYSSDWLSRDPSRPRLVHKLSGIASPRAQTALLVAVGYDFQRVSQLIRFFEPAKLMLALQADSPFPENRSKMERYVKELSGGDSCETFEIDAFQEDHGYKTLEERLCKVVDEYNVILGSLGPKLTAVSLYRIWHRWQHVSLVYAPANEFNPEYSRGLGAPHEGVLREGTTT